MKQKSMAKRLLPSDRRTSCGAGGVAPAMTKSRVDDQTTITDSEPSSLTPTTSFVVIEDWHAVLGDKHCGNRSTTATKILKAVKKEFKRKYTGKHRKAWYSQAIDRYHELIAQEFPNIAPNDRGQVLVQCTAQVLESDRVLEPFTYGYEGKEAIYGLAKVPEAIHFFFNSRDSPDLEQEVRKLRNKWLDLRRNTTKQPPKSMMDEFDDLLSFVERKLDAPDDNAMVTEILKGIKFIPVLQKSWKLLIHNMQPVVSMPPPTAAAPIVSTTSTSDEEEYEEVNKGDDFDEKLAEMGPLIAVDAEITLSDLIEFPNECEQGRDDHGDPICEPASAEEYEERLMLANFQKVNDEPTSITEETDLSVTAEFREKATIDDEASCTDQARSKGKGKQCIDETAETNRTQAPQKSNIQVFQSAELQSDEKEVVIETLQQEQLALKSQISHLHDMMRLVLQSKDGKTSPFDDHGSDLIFGEGHQQECGSICSSQASGRKRSRRTSRRSPASCHSRSLSVASKRSRNDRQDGSSVASDQVPLEIEMFFNAPKDHEDDRDSCESYESGELQCGLEPESGECKKVQRISNSHTLSEKMTNYKHRSMSGSPHSSFCQSETESGSMSVEDSDDTSNIAKVKHVSNVKIGCFKSGQYSGTISACTGMPHGRGRMVLQTPGAYYDGEWRHGKYEGRGRLVQKGTIYDGGFRNGKKHGPGAMSAVDGTKWNGVFANDEMVQGTMIFADGRKLEGVFTRKKIVHGVATYLDGSRYSGQWLDGLPHGNGTKVFSDGARYEGDFRKGVMSGPGKIFKPDGSVYEGEYMDCALTEFRSETSPYGIFNYNGLFRDGNGKEGRRIFRRVRDRAVQQNNHVVSQRGLQKGNVLPRRPGEKVLSQGFREGAIPGFSKKITEDGFLYVVDEGESSGGEKSSGDELPTEIVGPQAVATEARSRDGRFSRMIDSAKSFRLNRKLSRGRNPRDASSSRRSALSA